MSIVSGKMSTASAVGGMYIGWVFEFIPVEITILGSAVVQALEDPARYTLEAFGARLEVLDSATSLVTRIDNMTDIDLYRDTEAEQERWSARVVDAARYSPRNSTYPDLLRAGDIKKIVRISLTLTLQGVEHVFRVFTGLIVTTTSTYRQAETQFTVEGANLAALLTTADGTLTNFTGSRVNLITRLLKVAGLTDIYLAIPDALYTTAQTFLSQTVAGTLGRIFEALADYSYAVDTFGAFVARKSATLSTPNAWIYDTRKNMLGCADKINALGVETVVNVVGDTTAASLTYEDAALIAIYGRRIGSLSSSLLTTAQEATDAAKAQIEKTLRATRTIDLDGVTLNPVLTPGDFVTITDPAEASGGKGSGLSGKQLVVRRITMRWARSEPSGTMWFGGDLL